MKMYGEWMYRSTYSCPRHYLYGLVLNPLKTEFLLNNIYKSSPYLTGNTLRLYYKAHPVNVEMGTAPEPISTA
jgi:hypothetical protein